MDELSREAAESVDRTFADVHRGFQALGRLLHDHQGYLLAIANAELGDDLRGRLGGSDVVAVTFLRVFSHLDAATSGLMSVGSEAQFRAWVRTVLLNALSNERRRETANVRDVTATGALPSGSVLADASPSPSSVGGRRERDEVVRRAVAGLPEADRLLMRLRFWHDWSFPDLDELLTGERTEAGSKAVSRRLDKLYLSLPVDGG